MPVGGQNLEGLARERQQGRPRKTLRPMSIALERVQAHDSGVVAQINRSVVTHHDQVISKAARRQFGINLRQRTRGRHAQA
jgi:hypothetical protein